MKKSKNTQSILFIALFWGSIWGITEATVGHLLHLSRIPGLAGSLMFPIAVFFMTRAYSLTGRLSAVLYASWVAASLKIIDLFISPHNLFSVLNPMIAILCEALILFLFLKVWDKKLFSRFLPVLSLVLGWRLVYSAAIITLSQLYTLNSFLDLGLTRFLTFFVAESLISSLIIYLFFKIYHLPSRASSLQPKKFHYFLAAGVYILAVFVEFMI